MILYNQNTQNNEKITYENSFSDVNKSLYNYIQFLHNEINQLKSKLDELYYPYNNEN